MKMKIQSMQSLKKEMQSVARGNRKTSDDAAQPSFESVEAVIRLLTPENRHLLKTRVRHYILHFLDETIDEKKMIEM